jgi:hypothetical protein
VAQAMRRYKAVSERLAKEFKLELRRVVAIAAALEVIRRRLKPGRYPG